MSQFIDVSPYHWAYDDIQELYWIKMPDGSYFFRGIPYNAFEEGQEPLDEEVTVTSNGQSEFILNKIITPTQDNPLFIYVDGVQTAYSDVKANQPQSGKTYIKLARGVGAGSVVRFHSVGVPAMIPDDPLNRPVGVISEGVFPYAEIPLEDGAEYLYDPLSTYTSETARAQGRQLRKVYSFTDIEHEDDYAIISNRLYVHYNLNNTEVYVNYLVRVNGMIKATSAIVKPFSDKMRYYNRFFPATKISRAETIALINRFRIQMEMKYTDSEPYKSGKWWSRFDDVEDTKWYFQDIIDMEDFRLPDGSFILIGDGDGNLKPEDPLTRAEAVAFLNRCRKWFIEVFK